MLMHTRQTVHFGVGCVFSPQPVLDAQHSIKFQGDLADHGLVFTQAQTPPGAIVLTRDVRPLEVKVLQLGPAVGSVVVIAGAPPWATLDEFQDEAQTVFQAYSTAWSGQQLQVIQRECSMNQLYDVKEDHAFKFLWERRLGCQEVELDVLRRPVLGGGIHLVIPPSADGVDEPNVDLKVESLFANPTKLVVQVVMQWRVSQVQSALDPGPILREADRFLSEEVVEFIAGARP